MDGDNCVNLPYQTPKELLDDVKKNIQYGYINRKGDVIKGTENPFWWKEYRTLSIEEIEKYHVGVCYDTAYYLYEKMIAFPHTGRGILFMINSSLLIHSVCYYTTRIECYALETGNWHRMAKRSSISEIIQLYASYNNQKECAIFLMNPPKNQGLTYEEYVQYGIQSHKVYDAGDCFNQVILPKLKQEKML